MWFYPLYELEKSSKVQSNMKHSMTSSNNQQRFNFKDVCDQMSKISLSEQKSKSKYIQIKSWKKGRKIKIIIQYLQIAIHIKSIKIPLHVRSSENLLYCNFAIIKIPMEDQAREKSSRIQFSQTESNFEAQAKYHRNGSNGYLVILLILSVLIFSLAIYSQTPASPHAPPKEEIGQLQQTDESQLNQSEKTQISLTEKGQLKNILQYAPIHAGEIHFSRIPREYWEHRMLMLKAAGLNTIGVYIFWNHHELTKGVFDFTTGERDLIGFLELTKKYEFNVIIRPGPYVCAEWDFGGLPARLLGVPGLKIRQSNKLYEEQIFIYFTALSKVIRPYLQINGGNIILLQIENELGSLNQDFKYTNSLIKMWKELDIVCHLYYEDAQGNWMKHYWSGANFGISEGHHLYQFESLQKTQFFLDRLVFGGEVYTGWLTHWGQDWQGLPDIHFKERFNDLLSHNKSFSLYVAHGGTNFALTAGAIWFPNQNYQPHVTSYDYGAPITEQGRGNSKYKIFIELMEKYVGNISTPVPEPIQTISIPDIHLRVKGHLLGNLPEAINIQNYSFFESDSVRMYNQGIVVYQTILPEQRKYNFQLIAHDFALIYVDGEFIQRIIRRKWEDIGVSVECKKINCVLKIVIEAMGHVNYGELQAIDAKGLINFKDTDNFSNNFDWSIYRIHLNDTSIFEWTLFKEEQNEKAVGPVLLRGIFKLEQTGDTYFDTSIFQKGYVWVNDRLLGRYWNIGPQFRLYCPGVWLNKGYNKIYILQLGETTAKSIAGVQ